VGPALLVSTRTAVTGSDEEILQCLDIFKCVVMYSYIPPERKRTFESNRNGLRVKLPEVKSEFEGVVSKSEMILLEKDRIELEMKSSNHALKISLGWGGAQTVSRELWRTPPST